MQWRDLALTIPTLAISDPPHWHNKVRARTIDYTLRIGDFDVNFKPLADALKSFDFEKDTTLRASDLHADRMDFRASQRLFSAKVIDFLVRRHPNEKGALL